MMIALKDAVTFRTSQFHRLVTDEDGTYFHAHKTIGVLCLLHFVYRLIIGFGTGSMGFGPTPMTLAWICAHAILHITSFQFSISERRNKVYNIIWPEMRLHTAIFAYRSLLTMMIIWLADAGRISSIASVASRPFIVLGTMGLADIVSKKYAPSAGDTTMRGNPYPSYVDPKISRWHNIFYSVSQILATMNILVSTGMDRPFLMLLAIQTAPLGMTLVKKGVLTQMGWHFWYTLALLVNYVYPIWFLIERGIVPLALYVTIASSVAILRLGYRMDKYMLWTLASYACLLHFSSSSYSSTILSRTAYDATTSSTILLLE